MLYIHIYDECKWWSFCEGTVTSRASTARCRWSTSRAAGRGAPARTTVTPRTVRHHPPCLTAVGRSVTDTHTGHWNGSSHGSLRDAYYTALYHNYKHKFNCNYNTYNRVIVYVMEWCRRQSLVFVHWPI